MSIYRLRNIMMIKMWARYHMKEMFGLVEYFFLSYWQECFPLQVKEESLFWIKLDSLLLAFLLWKKSNKLSIKNYNVILGTKDVSISYLRNGNNSWSVCYPSKVSELLWNNSLIILSKWLIFSSKIFLHWKLHNHS